jgi:hypothetical protein
MKLSSSCQQKRRNAGKGGLDSAKGIPATPQAKIPVLLGGLRGTSAGAKADQGREEGAGPGCMPRWRSKAAHPSQVSVSPTSKKGTSVTPIYKIELKPTITEVRTKASACVCLVGRPIQPALSNLGCNIANIRECLPKMRHV